MAVLKIIFIIPGFRHKSTSIQYKNLMELLKSEGYIPITISIPWKGSTIFQNTQYFLKEYKRYLLLKKFNTEKRKIYLLGFSFGALIAFIAVTKIRVQGIILCSLSPFFKEDLTKKQLIKLYEHKKLHSKKLAKRLKTKQVHMLYGTSEATQLITRVKRSFLYIPSIHKYLTPVKAVSHDIGNRKYLYEIQKTARILY